MSTDRRSGDGFVRCSDGHVRWGVYGAAGVVFAVATDDGPFVLLQLRSQWSHEGGTWSCPGGALDLGETPLEGALREAGEEIGLPPGPIHPVGEYVFQPATDWRYTTVVIEVGHPFGAPLNFETAAIEWVSVSEVADRPLHTGFAGAWPHVLPLVESIGSPDAP